MSQEKIRKISDAIFAENDPPQDRSKPLEWRRGFNAVDFKLKNLKLSAYCHLHDTDFDWGDEDTKDPKSFIQPKPSRRTKLVGIVDDNDFADSLFYAVETEKGSNFFHLERARGRIEVNLVVEDPINDPKRSPEGTYRGSAFRMNCDPGEDYLCIEAAIPQDHMAALLTNLRRDAGSRLEVSFHLLSFTFEVDDALREHYHPRDIALVDSNLCLLSWAEAVIPVGTQAVEVAIEEEFNDLDEQLEESVSEGREQPLNALLLQSLGQHLKSQTSLVLAVWALVVMVGIHALFA